MKPFDMGNLRVLYHTVGYIGGLRGYMPRHRCTQYKEGKICQTQQEENKH